MIRIWMVLPGLCGALLAKNTGEVKLDEPMQKAMVTSTQHLDLGPGGTVRVKGATGDVTIQGWDQPGVDITTTKSTVIEYPSSQRDKAARELDPVQIAAQREGNGIAISTKAKERRFRSAKVTVEYAIKVPRDAALAVENGNGNIYIDGLTGDVQAKAKQGGIVLHLPQDGHYTIDAKSKIGSVTSDFPGGTRRNRLLFGHSFIDPTQAPHKLNLQIGFGDILILKTRMPQMPPLTSP